MRRDRCHLAGEKEDLGGGSEAGTEWFEKGGGSGIPVEGREVTFLRGKSVPGRGRVDADSRGLNNARKKKKRGEPGLRIYRWGGYQKATISERTGEKRIVSSRGRSAVSPGRTNSK